jgi:hypothetical protein
VQLGSEDVRFLLCCLVLMVHCFTDDKAVGAVDYEDVSSGEIER